MHREIHKQVKYTTMDSPFIRISTKSRQQQDLDKESIHYADNEEVGKDVANGRLIHNEIIEALNRRNDEKNVEGSK